jgi:acetate kinase
VLDTTFHSTLPAAARTYALPQDWNDQWQLRRYGFHGLSHAHAVRRAAELVGRPVEDLRVVSCHPGAGASLAAVLGGTAVDTTMGFTPLVLLSVETSGV